MPRGIYQRRPRLQLITDQRPNKRKSPEFRFPSRFVTSMGGVLRCRIVHEFVFEEDHRKINMAVIEVDRKPAPDETRVDMFLVVPRFRVRPPKTQGK